MRRTQSVMLSILVASLLIAAYMFGTQHALQPGIVYAADDCQMFTQTNHQVCGAFLQYWQNNGGLAQQGYPISDPFMEMSATDGKTYQVQYFERAVFELHPELPAGRNVLLSLLGSEKYKTKYGGKQPSGAAVQAAATATVPTATTAMATAPMSTPIPTQTSASTQGSVQTFSGTGTKVTPKFALTAGLVAFKSISKAGQDNFIAHLTDPNGNELALAANQIGPSMSSTVANVKQDGMYTLAVTYDGAWTIEVDNPGSVLNNPISVPTTLTGSGRMITQPLMLMQGSLTVNYTSMAGSDNFIADLVDSSGRNVGLGANEIGPSSGSRIIRIPSTGVYLFGVQYDGKWTLALTQG